MRLNREKFLAALIALEATGAAACSKDEPSKDQTRVLGAAPAANPAAEGFPIPPTAEGGVPPTREGSTPVHPVAEAPPPFFPPTLEGLPVPAVPGLPAAPTAPASGLPVPTAPAGGFAVPTTLPTALPTALPIAPTSPNQPGKTPRLTVPGKR